MDGDEQRRFCEKCDHHVNNFAKMSADEAEAVLNQPGRICARVVVSPSRGILTRDGWIPRLAVAGAIAFSVAGCTSTSGDQGTKQTAMAMPPQKSPKTAAISQKVDHLAEDEKLVEVKKQELTKEGEDQYGTVGIVMSPGLFEETERQRKTSKK